MDEIIWKRMLYHGKDLGDYYLVSNTGEIKGVKTGKIRKKNIDHQGYYFVNISLGTRCIRPTIKIHRAVAETFLINVNNYQVINHKDGNKLNNNIENLEWCTQKYNTQHAIQNRLADPGHGRKRVVKIDVNTNEILQIFESIREAQLSFNILKNTGTIGDCIRGRIKTAYGYKWKFV